MFYSDQLDKIIPALRKAQKEIPPISKDSKSHNGKYASLEDILDVIRPYLDKHELSIHYGTSIDDIFTTSLFHDCGQFIKSNMRLKDVDGKGHKTYEQAYGTQLTYMKRYQLLLVLGMQPGGEDNDGNYTSVNNINDVSNSHYSEKAMITDEQVEYLEEICKKQPHLRNVILKLTKRKSLDELTEAQYHFIVSTLKKGNY